MLHALEIEQVREHEGNHEVFPVENVRVNQLHILILERVQLGIDVKNEHPEGVQ
jgi:hypothetical protein